MLSGAHHYSMFFSCWDHARNLITCLTFVCNFHYYNTIFCILCGWNVHTVCWLSEAMICTKQIKWYGFCTILVVSFCFVSHCYTHINNDNSARLKLRLWIIQGFFLFTCIYIHINSIILCGFCPYSRCQTPWVFTL